MDTYGDEHSHERMPAEGSADDFDSLDRGAYHHVNLNSSKHNKSSRRSASSKQRK